MNSATTLAALVAQCRKLARHHQTNDAELLRRLAEQRDAAAFEELLERHASLVWGVCRRIVRSEADCEDAFQAVFLALFRQSNAIDPRRPLGAWLHGVAVRAALKAATDSARKATIATVPEQATSGDIADELANRELFRVVDEEIARLPELRTRQSLWIRYQPRWQAHRLRRRGEALGSANGQADPRAWRGHGEIGLGLRRFLARWQDHRRRRQSRGGDQNGGGGYGKATRGADAQARTSLAAAIRTERPRLFTGW